MSVNGNGVSECIDFVTCGEQGCALDGFLFTGPCSLLSELSGRQKIEVSPGSAVGRSSCDWAGLLQVSRCHAQASEISVQFSQVGVAQQCASVVFLLKVCARGTDRSQVRVGYDKPVKPVRDSSDIFYFKTCPRGR